MITEDNFWDTDLDKIESVFLEKGQKITDLPTSFSDVVPVQGSVLLNKTINIDAVVPNPSLFSHLKVFISNHI